MNGEDKMIQITFKRQRKRRGLELPRLRRNEREMVELLWVGLGATKAGVLTELKSFILLLQCLRNSPDKFIFREGDCSGKMTGQREKKR